MSSSGIALRPATDEDYGFLARVYASTREEELAFTNWSIEEKTLFCQSQFDAQTAHYQLHYPGAEYQVVLHDGVPAGRLSAVRWPGEIRIMDIALLPEFRRRGIGTSLLQDLMAEAGEAGKTLSIHVERFNPALNLYVRLGFELAEDKGVYLLMERRIK